MFKNARRAYAASAAGSSTSTTRSTTGFPQIRAAEMRQRERAEGVALERIEVGPGHGHEQDRGREHGVGGGKLAPAHHQQDQGQHDPGHVECRADVPVPEPPHVVVGGDQRVGERPVVRRLELHAAAGPRSPRPRDATRARRRPGRPTAQPSRPGRPRAWLRPDRVHHRTNSTATTRASSTPMGRVSAARNASTPARTKCGGVAGTNRSEPGSGGRRAKKQPTARQRKVDSA